MKVRVKKLNPDAVVPKVAHSSDVGLDLVSVDFGVLRPGERKLYGCGISIAPEPGYEAQIRPRSGLALKHGVTVLNTPGTVEPTYRGEVKVLLINTSQENYEVKKGDRIAQVVFKRYEEVVDIEEVSELEETSRGKGGFGHSGR